MLDAVAFGHHYVSNPDLVERARAGVKFVEPNSATFYTNDAEGYTDYPTYQEAAAAEAKSAN